MGEHTMPKCPICQSEAKPLDVTGDFSGFDCPKHGRFKVAGTVFENVPTKSAGPQQWEAALKKAQAKAGTGWPLITTNEF